MQRNFEPMRKQVEAWQRSELTDARAKRVIYKMFVAGNRGARGTSRTRRNPETATILCGARILFLLQFGAARSVPILSGHSFETTVVHRSEEPIGWAKGERSTIVMANLRFRIRHSDARRMAPLFCQDLIRQVVHAAVWR